MGLIVSNWKKFVLLLWKDWLLQWRHKWRTFFELALPLLITSLLLLVRYYAKPVTLEGPTYFEALNTSTIGEWSSNTFIIAYSPTNTILEKLINKSMDFLVFEETPTDVVSYGSAADLNDFLVENQPFVGIEFPDLYSTLEQLPENVEFTIRFPKHHRLTSISNRATLWRLNERFFEFKAFSSTNKFKGDKGAYWQEGFIAVQCALSRAIIEATGGEPTPILLQKLPFPKYVSDEELFQLQNNFSFFTILAMALPAVSLVKYLIMEKERQLKETMKIVGLPNWLHWTSWFFKEFLQFGIITLMITVLFKVNSQIIQS